MTDTEIRDRVKIIKNKIEKIKKEGWQLKQLFEPNKKEKFGVFCFLCEDFKVYVDELDDFKYSMLSKHIRFIHGVTSKEYYDRFLTKEHLSKVYGFKYVEEKICACGKEKDFRDINFGYRLFCSRDCEAANANRIEKSKLLVHTEEFKQSIRDNAPWKFKGPFGNGKGFKVNLTQKRLAELQELMRQVNSSGIKNTGGCCKFFKVDGVILQGRYELYFYLNQEVKPTRPKPIKTPFGFYTPDFEFEYNFIEIKSTYTIKTSAKSGQLKKIHWVKHNVKNLKVLILKEADVEWYLKGVDIDQYKYIPTKTDIYENTNK